MVRVVLILLVLSLAHAGVVYADESMGKLTETCKSCHTDKVEAVEFRGPQLGGFSESYIMAQLQNFKKGRRGVGSPSAVAMANAVKDLSDSEFEQLSEWASSQESIQTLKDQADSDSEGETLYKEHCSGCHNGFFGKLFTGSPRLDYLNADYIEQQLKLFANDQRGFGEPGKHQLKMKFVAKKLSSQQTGHIVDYLRKERTSGNVEAVSK